MTTIKLESPRRRRGPHQSDRLNRVRVSRLKALVFGVAAAVGVASLGACGGDDDNEQPLTIGFITPQQPFYDPIETAAVARAEEIGVEIHTARGESSAEVLSALEGMPPLNALVIRASDATCEELRNALDESTSLVQLDSIQFESCDHLYANVATDNTALGEAGGQQLASLLGSGGAAVVLAVPSRVGIESVESRREGGIAALTTAGDTATAIDLPTPYYFQAPSEEFGTCCELSENIQEARAAIADGSGVFTTFAVANDIVAECVLADCELAQCETDCGIVAPIGPEGLAINGWVGVDLTETTETMLCTDQMDVVLVQDQEGMGVSALNRAVESVEVTDWATHVPINDNLSAIPLTKSDVTCN